MRRSLTSAPELLRGLPSALALVAFVGLLYLPLGTSGCGSDDGDDYSCCSDSIANVPGECTCAESLTCDTGSKVDSCTPITTFDDGPFAGVCCYQVTVGAHAAVCDCGPTTTCSAGYVEVPDCTTEPKDVSPTSTPSADAGSAPANVCPEGPGTCADGDSSTCGCGESCVQTAECAGCAYECVKGCATDADCTGYYSGDTPPVPLTCIGASSTMPTAHCGI